MNHFSFAPAALSGLALTVSLVACTATPGEPTDDENIGIAEQAVCAAPGCTTLPPVTLPFRREGPSFDCRQDLGPKLFWTPAGACTDTPSTVCDCQLRERKCPNETKTPGCGGSSLVSVYTCPRLYPVLYCNVYGACTCWSS